MLTDAELDELERLEKGATKGPWCEHPNGTSVWSGENYGDFEHDARHLFNAMQCGTAAVDDTFLVCAARNALPALLADLRSARATIAEMRELIGNAPHEYQCSWSPNRACDCWKSEIRHGAEATGGRTEGEP